MTENKHIGFGVFILSIGVILLLINIGIINWTILGSLFELWPVILIVIGINIIFHHNRIIKIITWLLFLAVIIAHSYFYRDIPAPDYSGLSDGKNVRIEKMLENERGNLEVDLSGTRLTIDSTNSSLVNANLTSSNIRHKVDYKDNNKTAYVLFEEVHPFNVNINPDKNDCKLDLDESVIWDIDVDAGAVNGTFDMSDLKVENMDIDVGAANLKLMFGSRNPSTDIKLDAGASNIDVVIPQNVGVRVKMDTALSNTNLKGMEWDRQGDFYTSANYNGAENKINFDVDMAAGKFDVSFQ